MVMLLATYSYVATCEISLLLSRNANKCKHTVVKIVIFAS